MNTQEINNISYKESSNLNIHEDKLQQEPNNPIIIEEFDNKDVPLNDINNSNNQDLSNYILKKLIASLKHLQLKKMIVQIKRKKE